MKQLAELLNFVRIKVQILEISYLESFLVYRISKLQVTSIINNQEVLQKQ